MLVEFPVDVSTPSGEGRYKFDASILPVGRAYEERLDSLAKHGVSSAVNRSKGQKKGN